MKAYRLINSEFELIEEGNPRPQRGELLVRIRAVSLNYRDVALLRDRYPWPHRNGLVPVSDAAGEVIEVGEEVEAFKVGDRVMSSFHPHWFGGRASAELFTQQYGSDIDGWLVEQKVVNQEAVVKIPDSLTDEEASTLPCAALTAWVALTGSVPIRAGHTILTQGTGGVSIFAVQLAKAVGAKVISTTSSAAKADRLRTLGADEIVNYKEEARWGLQVRALTKGRGVDRVVEVGGPGTMGESLDAVAYGGEIASIGFLSTDNPGIDFFKLKKSGATFQNIAVGSRDALRELTQAIVMAGIKPVIDRVFDFNAAGKAFTYLESGAHFGKVVIKCS